MRDLFNRIKGTRATDPLVQTNADTAIVSQIVDLAGYESIAFLIATGTLTDVNATFNVQLDEGAAANLSDAAAVAAKDIQIDPNFDGTPTGNGQANFTFAKDNAVLKIGYIGGKRYVRVTITPSGNDSGAAPIAVIAVQGNARHQPAGATQTP